MRLHVSDTPQRHRNALCCSQVVMRAGHDEGTRLGRQQRPVVQLLTSREGQKHSNEMIKRAVLKTGINLCDARDL